MNNDIRVGCIMQSYEATEKYKVYLTHGFNELREEEFLGTAKDYQAACRLIKRGLKERKINSEPYWRTIMGSEVTTIDFGSWTKFAIIIPRVDEEEILGKK